MQMPQTSYRCAYTINNFQPVLCTIIGSEPLFYMDYEYDSSEEDRFEAEFMGVLEKELETLEKHIKKMDAFSKEDGDKKIPEKNSFELFWETQVEMTDSLSTLSNNKASTKNIIKTLEKSRFAASLLEVLDQNNITINYELQARTIEYCAKEKTISINPEIDETGQILLLARELRRVWQDKNKARFNPLRLHPDDAVFINRLQTADLVTAMVRIAWELQLAGHEDAWNALEVHGLDDVGRAYATEAYNDFRTINNGQASSAALEAWFLSERCKYEDKKLIQAMLADYKGYVFADQAGAAPAIQTLISAIGSMPFGKNYLVEHIHILMNDPVFREVRDRSNANFLWFVKFERTFRDSEQELQLNPAPFIGGTRTPTKNKNQEQGYEQTISTEGTDGQVINYLSEKSRRGERNSDSQNAGSGAEIIYFRNKNTD